MTWRRTVALLGLLVTLGGSAAVAQTHPRLAAIVRLAQDGLADSARAELSRFLTGLAATDSLYPEALYTSGLLAASDEERRLALRKVIVEHSRSEWADDAILLLGQLEYANGNPGGTVTQISRLLDDYPLSPLRTTAAFWGARAASDLGQAELACHWADDGLAAAIAEIELRNQLEYQKQRCQALVALRADSAARATRPRTEAAPPPPPASRQPPSAAPAPGTGIFVQVAAVDSPEAAERPATALRGLGYAVVTVREGGFHKVRAGPFATRAEAQTALTRIRSRLGGQPFIVTVR